MKRLAKKLFKTLEKENGEVPQEVDREIPNYQEIEDHKEAKATMKAYLEETLSKVEENIDLENCIETKELLDNVKEILNDPKFMEQKGVRSIVDQDARVSEAAYRINEDLHSYNKDSDEWFCVQGNHTVRKLYQKTKDRQYYRYYFEREKCRNCPLREMCIKGKNVGKVL